MKQLIACCVLPVLAVSAVAQIPTPSPTPRTAPRAAWYLVTTTGLPTQRRDNPGAANDNTFFVFGGRNGNANSTTHNALFKYDGTSFTTLTADTTAAGFPQARGGAAVAWNFTTNRLVVFGGDSGTGLVGTTAIPVTLLGDTWEFDPATNTWTDVTPVAGSPSARRFSSMTWDPSTGGMILFGGEDAITSPLTTPRNDSWLFLSGVWIPLSPTTTPPGRRLHSLVTRRDIGDVIMVAGDDASVTPQVRHLDVWRWDGQNWSSVPTNGTIPHGTTAAQAVYDELRQRLVITGGQGISVPNTAGGGQYGDLYGGSPSSWSSEFDFATNTWNLYGAATFGTNDTVIGRTSRYFACYLRSTGKVYKVSGQNSSGTGSVSGLCEYQANPVASADTYGTGCSGAGGLMSLAADSRPWTGRTVTLTASGFATSPAGLGFGVVGFSATSVPLSTLFPLAGATCDLLVNQVSTLLLVPSAGTASWQITVPTTTSLAGLPVKAQALGLEFDSSLNITSLVSSNGVGLVVGAL